MYFRPDDLKKLKEQDPGMTSWRGRLGNARIVLPKQRFNSQRQAELSQNHSYTRLKTQHEDISPGDKETPMVILGPIVGLVTCSSARILIETNVHCQGRIEVRGYDKFMRNNHSKEMTVEFMENEPTSFVIQGLRPDYTYTLKSSIPINNLLNCTFRTLPASRDSDLQKQMEGSDTASVRSGTNPFQSPSGVDEFLQSESNTEIMAPSLEESTVKIALVSSNDVSFIERDAYPGAPIKEMHYCQYTKASLWQDLYKKIQDLGIHMVIHLGNNIQVGGKRTRTLFQKMASEEEGLTPEYAYRTIQEEYHKVWNEPWTKAVLASCSNIMIYSEADIGKLVKRVVTLNEFGNPIGLDQEEYAAEVDATIARAALKAYHNYQQATWSNKKQMVDAEWQSAHEFCRNIKLSRYLSLLLIDTCTNITFGKSATMFHPSVMRTVRHALYKSRDQQGVQQLGSNLAASTVADGESMYQTSSVADAGSDRCPQRALLVLSPSRICDNQGVFQHPNYRAEAHALLDALFQWKAAAPRNYREVCFVSAACRWSNFASGTFEVIDAQTQLKMTEYAIGPISAPIHVDASVGSGTFFDKFCTLMDGPAGKATFNFTSGRYTYRKVGKVLQQHEYGILTFGADFDCSSVQGGTPEWPQSFLVCAPTFWLERFSVEEALKPTSHRWAYPQFHRILTRAEKPHNTRMQRSTLGYKRPNWVYYTR